MIKKTVLSSFFFFVAHYSIVFLAPPNWLGYPQNIVQGNLISAERMLFSDESYENIIVGSSLAYNIDLGQLDETWYNLSFPGQSIFEGLEIIHEMKNKPQRIFIETNVLLRKKNTFFHSVLFNPLKYPFKKYFSILKESQQPVSLIGDPVEYHLVRKFIPSNEEVQSISIKKEILKKKIITELKKEYNQVPEQAIRNQIKHLSTALAKFRNSGIEIVFFEMPIEKELCDTPQTSAIRNAIKSTFPKYELLVQPDCGEYTTSDGLHLDLESAKNYTSLFYQINQKRLEKRGS